MKNLQIFDYKGKEIRTVEKDGVTWWVLRDVCGVLNLTNQSRVAERLEADEVSNLELPHPQSKEKMLEK